MSTKRIMNGIADFTGQRVNTLLVNRMVSRYPAPRYAVTCEQCGSQTTAAQSQLTSGAARCLASGCGREHIAATLNDTPRRAREREEQRQRAEQQEQEERQAADLEQSEATFKETATKLGQVIRERILTGKDDAFQIDPATQMPDPTRQGTIEEWHRQQGEEFKRRNPDYYPTDANFQTIVDYINRNAPGIKLVSALQLEQAYRRLHEYGLIEQRPAPKSPERPQPSRVNLNIERAPEPQPSGPEKFIGRDDATGLQREFTALEVERMTADQYRRAFKVLPTFREWFIAADQQRAAQ